MYSKLTFFSTLKIKKNIYGEIFLMDQAAKDYFDEFEGIHEDFYSCERIQVREITESNEVTDQVHDVFIYMMNNVNESLLLNEKTLLLDRYTAKSDLYGEYQPKLDKPEHAQQLASQIKTLDKKD